MTREEISEKAAFLTMQVTLRLSGSGSDMIEAATDEMVKFYRATLEEAARAVCVECEAGTQISERVPGGRWMHVDHYGACGASEIHDLISALEVKGE